MDMKKRYAGVISFVVGVLGALYGWGTISSDKDSYSIWGGYNYESPLTGHEVTMIFVVVISVLLMIFGLYLIYASSRGSRQDTESQNISDVEHIKQYKELLDSKVITQEEFDDLKKKVIKQ